jgi:hypothetical protein
MRAPTAAPDPQRERRKAARRLFDGLLAKPSLPPAFVPPTDAAHARLWAEAAALGLAPSPPPLRLFGLSDPQFDATPWG